MVLRPGFGPGSTAREAVILDRTILPEQPVARGYSNGFGLIKIAIAQAPCFAPMASKLPPPANSKHEKISLFKREGIQPVSNS